MQTVQMESSLPCEVVDEMFKRLSTSKMKGKHFQDFTNEIDKVIPKEVLSCFVDSFIFVTLSGNYQQKIIICIDKEKRSAESVRQLFYSVYGEVFYEGSDRTKSAAITQSDSTYSIFGIITDRVDDVIMFE